MFDLFNFNISSYKLGDILDNALSKYVQIIFLVLELENNRSIANKKGKSNVPIILSEEFIERLKNGYRSRNNFTYLVNNLIEIISYGDQIKYIYTSQYLSYIDNVKTQIEEETLLKENKIMEKEINNKLNYFRFLNFSLYLLALDLLFLFMITFPICTMIELYKTNCGYTYVFQIILIAYQCDNGALLFGKLFGKRKFGFPITPTKTYEGIFGAFFLGYKNKIKTFI